MPDRVSVAVPLAPADTLAPPRSPIDTVPSCTVSLTDRLVWSTSPTEMPEMVTLSYSATVTALPGTVLVGASLAPAIVTVRVLPSVPPARSAAV